MLFLFRTNRSTTALTLALYVGALHLAACLGWVPLPKQEIAQGGSLYQSFFWWVEDIPRASALLATVFVYVQALLINYLADTFRLLPERSWLPGLFYALVASMLPEFLYLSPPLVGATFVPIALDRLFRTYKQGEVAYLVFDAAIWLTVGSLFFPPLFFSLVAGFVGLGIMRSFKLRERLVYFAGILVPFFLAWLWYFWCDNGRGFWTGQLSGYSGFYHFAPQWTLKTIMAVGLLGALFLILLLSTGTYFHKKLIQAQKCITVLYWFLIVGALSLLLQGDFRTTQLLSIMPMVGIFLSMTVSSFRSRAFAELLHLVLLGAIFFAQFT